jgi:hypothetical protein
MSGERADVKSAPTPVAYRFSRKIILDGRAGKERKAHI